MERKSYITIPFGIIFMVVLTAGITFLTNKFLHWGKIGNTPVALVMLGWLILCFKKVEPNHKGILEVLGAPKNIIYNNGVHWIFRPFVDIIEIDTRTQLVEIGEPSEEHEGCNMLEVVTGSALTPPVTAVAFIEGEIRYKIIGPILSIKISRESFKRLLTAKVESMLRVEAGVHTIEQYISKKSTLTTMVSTAVRGDFAEFGVIVEEVILREIIPSKGVLEQQARIKKEETDGLVTGRQITQFNAAMTAIKAAVPDLHPAEQVKAAKEILELNTGNRETTIKFVGLPEGGGGDLVAAVAALTQLNQGGGGGGQRNNRQRNGGRNGGR